MKIGHPTAGVHEAASTTTAPAARATQEESAARAAQASDDSAKVELSSTAASLISSARGTPADIDAAKVSRIAQAIAGGSYKIDAEAIADKLIANAQEVLGRVQR